MATPDLSLRIDQTRATVPTAEANLGLEYVSADRSSLNLVSGLPVSSALGYAGFGNDSFVNNAIKTAGGGLVPQDMTTAVYQNIHLVAGTKLVIETAFRPGDTVHNDEAFSILKNLRTGDLTPTLIANVRAVNANGTQNYTVTYTIGSTDNYNLMLGVADIADRLRPSTLSIKGISMVIPGGQYSVLPSGVQLADSSLLRSDGSLQIGSTLLPSALSNSGASLVSALESLRTNGLISQDGGGLISQDGGGVISNDGSSLISQDGGGLISQDGGGLISEDGTGIISRNGTGVISNDGSSFSGAQLAQIASNLNFSNAAQLRAYTATSGSGLASGNYGIMSLNGTNTPVPGGSTSTSTAPVPGLEVSASESAAANRFDDRSAVADLGNGQYVVAFSEYVRNTTGGAPTYTIRAQVLNADGTTSGTELTVSPPLPGTTSYGTPANQVNYPSVASLGGGSFVVAWQNGNNIRPGQYGGFSTGSDLFAQVINADGSKLGGPISLDPQTTNAQYTGVKVAALTGGGFVAVWAQQAAPTNSLSSIHGKLFNADGTQRGNEFSINGSSLLADLRNPAVAAKSGGGFTISFDGRLTDPSTGSVITGIAAQSYDSSGTATSRNPALVAASDTDNLAYSSLAILPNGNVAVAWTDTAGTGYVGSVNSIVLSPSLVALQTQPTVITDTAATYYSNSGPSVTALSDGRFAVGYTSAATTQSRALAQIVNADNTTAGSPFAIYAPGGGDGATNPAVLQLGTGTLLATSTHNFYSIGASDVRAIPIDIGGSTAAAPVVAGRALASGSAVHGYVSGGTIFADANGNGTRDANEAAATTTADGAFALPPDATGALVLTGGTDIATGQPFTGRYTAPDGSHAINAVTTLIQGVLSRGADIGTAQMKVATALGLSADASLTDLDPMAAAQGSPTGRALLLANALVADMADLATAAGSPDALGAFAASIAAQGGFTAFDPSSPAAMAAAGLSGQVLTDAAAIAASVKALLNARSSADGSDAALLANDVNRLEVIVQGAATAFAAAIGTGTTSAVAAAYTGDALQSKFDGTSTGITASTVGVYRFFDSRYGTHFFTGSADERNTILATRPDLVNEGVGLTAVDPATKDPNAAPVFRFFDTKFGTHFFTASTTERDQVLATRQDLTFEGTGFYEHTTQQAGDTPVYRFFDKNFGTHFYTGDSGERATILATRSDLVDEGIGFYAPKAAS